MAKSMWLQGRQNILYRNRLGVYFPQVVTYTGGEFDGVEPEYGLSKRWPVSNFEYKEFNTTKVRIKPYRNGFRFEITFANGKKPNHVYNTRAAAKKGLKDLAEALTNYEIVKWYGKRKFN